MLAVVRDTEEHKGHYKIKQYKLRLFFQSDYCEKVILSLELKKMFHSGYSVILGWVLKDQALNKYNIKTFSFTFIIAQHSSM